MCLLGQAIYFVSGTLFFFTIVSFIGLHLLVVVYEEPVYRALYREGYAEYCRRVPRCVCLGFVAIVNFMADDLALITSTDIAEEKKQTNKDRKYLRTCNLEPFFGGSMK